jgi:hypothetical protein
MMRRWIIPLLMLTAWIARRAFAAITATVKFRGALVRPLRRGTLLLCFICPEVGIQWFRTEHLGEQTAERDRRFAGQRRPSADESPIGVIET